MRASFRTTGLALLAVMIAGAAPPSSPPLNQLKVIAIDVEGGAATLYITPQGHSLLVDTGWPAGLGAAPGAPQHGGPSSAELIAATALANGLTRIDHVLVTHYHVDHVGGLAELVTRIPVGEVIDHGPNREVRAAASPTPARDFSPQALYPQYEQAIRSIPRRSLSAGSKFRIDDLLVTIVNSDRAVVGRPLPGAGRPGAGCGNLENKGDLGGEENPRSLGFVASWGRARILSLGDTTWDVEQQLVCPLDRIGPIDVMFADNHGTDNSNSKVLIATVHPRVVVLGNGAAKGAMPASMRTFSQAPGYNGVWQLHYATRNAPADNTRADQIANPADQPDAMNPLLLLIAKSGMLTVNNSRTGGARIYAPSALKAGARNPPAQGRR